ncbi:hypothetical protein EW146_g3037 [Bondarzewia mesenterica]|uniref:non-specific serine/threonine protein kinase n=1 Tax=Bondarzewia mesenterica TaxID=1095465 RepID=A0A4S4M129_9AGAM|nr:hypothetical protein EW146_g3037 [Bondarzewia mesenterica]
MPRLSSTICDLTGAAIDNGSLTLLEQIGNGAFGVVYHAVDTTKSPTPREYAVKCLKKFEPGSKEQQMQAHELSLHQRVSDHPGVVTVHRIIDEHKDFIFVVMDLWHGDLFTTIRDHMVFYRKDELVKQAFIQLIDAVEYCHHKGVYHRDLKPENVLCSMDGSRLYLADFGLSTSHPVTSDFNIGTQGYMSPECRGVDFDFEAYSSDKNDVWALGIFLINMLMSIMPWDRAELDNDARFPITTQANELLHRILCPIPHLRITLADLRSEVMKVERFFVTDEEIAQSPERVRLYAGKLADLAAEVSPPRPRSPVTRSMILLVPALTFSSSAETDSDLVTPETHPADASVGISDVSDGADIGEPLVLSGKATHRGRRKSSAKAVRFFARTLRKLKMV